MLFRRIVKWLEIAGLACISAAAVAAEDATGPRWACWYVPAGLSVDCLLSRTPAVADVPVRTDTRLPEIVRTIWGHPGQVADQRITIPLLSTPFDMSFVAELAGAVMCGGRQDCSVHFDENPDGRGALRAAAIRSGEAESAVMAELLRQGFTLAVVTAAALGVDASGTEKPARRRRALRS